MSHLTDDERAAFAAVDDALRTYPLQPAPPILLPAVLARVRAERSAPQPRFRLAWIDYAVSLFVAGMAGLLLLLWQSIPPLEAARAQMQVAIWLKLSGLDRVWPALAGGMILMAGALLAAGVVFARAQAPARR